MIIWKGLGILAAIIPIIFIVTSNSILGSEVVGWAILTSAIPVWLLGRYFYKRPAQLMVDSETDQNILVKPEHSLFWVEMDYWAIILVIFGIANVLPINIREASLGIAIILMGIVFFGRLGFSLYHKYIKNENVKTSNFQNQSIPNVNPKNKKEDRMSRFTKKSKNKKMATSSIVNAKNNNNEKGLNESELKKKAYYAEMRKAREAPKKFASSDHSNYFPGSKMPFIPKNAIMNKNTSEEE